MNREMILVLDFGGQYNQLIARCVRECKVYAEVHPYTMTMDEILKMDPKGIIFTGGPNSVYEESSPHYDKAILDLGIPILGVCYGSQLMAYMLDGKVETAPVSEYGRTRVTADTSSKLLHGIEEETDVWMSHTDYIAKAPEGFRITAHSEVCPVAAMENADRKLYATQFHPEVTHTKEGRKILSNFVYTICNCAGDWKIDSFVDDKIKQIRETVGDGKALCALSGGVDSSVAAVLMSKAIGKNLTCVFVDHGLLRKDEGDQVEAIFGPSGNYDLNFIRVNAADRFYEKLAGVEEPEKKRKIIGEEFIRVFEEQAKKIGAVDFLVQGTIYPDVIESGLGKSAVIKSHHNVGGLPDCVDFKDIIEPLRMLFKDEVRRAGRQLGLPDNLVNRQPFPGPGLGVRCVGAITRDRLEAVRESDAILREEFAAAGLEGKVWQYFTVVPPFTSTGIKDGKRTDDWMVIIRAVNSTDATSATIEEIPYDLLKKIRDRIFAEVKGVNRVLYDLSTKGPATIEYE